MFTNIPLKFCHYVRNKWWTQGQATVKHGYTFHSRRPNSTLTSLRPVHVSSRTLAMHASDEEATCSRISRSIVNCARARVVVNPLVHCHDIVRVVSVSLYPLLHAASLRRTSVVVPVVRNRKWNFELMKSHFVMQVRGPKRATSKGFTD
jgi:hypothetical protein